MVQFDPSESVNRMADAKMCDADDTTYDRTHDDIGYKIRTGRYTSREKEARRAGQKALNGGPKLYKKIKRMWDNPKRKGKLK